MRGGVKTVCLRRYSHSLFQVCDNCHGHLSSRVEEALKRESENMIPGLALHTTDPQVLQDSGSPSVRGGLDSVSLTFPNKAKILDFNKTYIFFSLCPSCFSKESPSCKASKRGIVPPKQILSPWVGPKAIITELGS